MADANLKRPARCACKPTLLGSPALFGGTPFALRVARMTGARNANLFCAGSTIEYFD